MPTPEEIKWAVEKLRSEYAVPETMRHVNNVRKAETILAIAYLEQTEVYLLEGWFGGKKVRAVARVTVDELQEKVDFFKTRIDRDSPVKIEKVDIV